jgi:hypothetical protein
MGSRERIDSQIRRAEVRKILRFIRAADRLREVTTKHSFNTTLRWLPQPEILHAPDWTIVENLLAKFRPLYRDSEECSFRNIVKILPKHVGITGGPSCADLERRWDEILQASTSPMPVGSKVSGVVEGFDVIAEAEGRMAIAFDSVELTGREAIDLSLYGELVHIDGPKERKRLRIRASEIEPGYKVALLGVLMALLQVVDQLRHYAQLFIDHFPAEKIEEIESNR